MDYNQRKYLKLLQKLYIESLERIDELEYTIGLYQERLKDKENNEGE